MLPDAICQQLLCIRKWGTNPSTQYYGGQTGYNEIAIVDANIVDSSHVAASGVVMSGASPPDYQIIGIAIQDAPLDLLTWGTTYDNTVDFQTSSDFENLQIYGYVTDEPVWVCYSGTAPTIGEYVTLSSGTDGYVEALASADFYHRIVIGKVMGIASGSTGGPQHLVDSTVPVVLVDPSFKRGW